jgi:hypothetical protein
LSKFTDTCHRYHHTVTLTVQKNVHDLFNEPIPLTLRILALFNFSKQKVSFSEHEEQIIGGGGGGIHGQNFLMMRD